MRTIRIEILEEIYSEHKLSDDEMLSIRGGSDDGDPIILPNPPPVRI